MHPPAATNKDATVAGPNIAESSLTDESRSCRVYVGNLAWEITDEDLNEFVKTTAATAGHEVTRSDIMRSALDGRSKGCGIVEFATAEGAKHAVLTLNDKEFKGRQIFVREDREGRVATTGAGGGSGASASGSTSGSASGHYFSTGEQAQSRRVYVGNLSWDVNWAILKDHMRQAGEVVHVDVICESNGRSKGCGIVEYATEEGAKAAISTLTHTELNGRTIFVREDRETSKSSGGGPSASAGPGGFGTRFNNNVTPNSTSVYVWNLSYETTWQALKDHCRRAGNVDQVTILTSDGTSSGSGIVVYQKASDAARAIRELQDSELNGRPIKLREDRMQSGGGGGRGRGGGGRGRFGGRGHRTHGDGGGRGSYPGSTTGTTGSSTLSGTQLFVGNLSYDTNWRDLKDLFQQCGQVDRADVRSGFGTVRFIKKEDAERAIQKLNGVELKGRAMEVRLDQKANR